MKKGVKTTLFVLAGLVGLNAACIALWKRIWNLKNASKPGNAEAYHPENAPQKPDSPLQGKTILFLGSSVTKGAASLDKSFVEYLERIDGITAVKEAVSGTTLVTMNEKSYIPRMKTMDPGIRADAFVCQLSTNDATRSLPLGEVTDSFDMADFDTATVAGAIEYIIAYAQETWHCPVLFYTGTRYNSEAYGQMVELLLKIREKWGIGVIDLWNDAEMNAVGAEDYALYMADGIHPTQAGYLLWWTPKFELGLIDFLNQAALK